jgi:hypothetical protein
MELLNRFSNGGYEIENHISVKGGNYIHRQVEKKDGRIFMRMKTRKLLELNPYRTI